MMTSPHSAPLLPLFLLLIFASRNCAFNDCVCFVNNKKKKKEIKAWRKMATQLSLSISAIDCCQTVREKKPLFLNRKYLFVNEQPSRKLAAAGAHSTTFSLWKEFFPHHITRAAMKKICNRYYSGRHLLNFIRLFFLSTLRKTQVLAIFGEAQPLFYKTQVKFSKKARN